MSISLQQQSATHGTVEHDSAVARLMPALAAVALGALLVFSMGFANVSALHNAAHDGRHSAGFPCH